MGKWGSVRPAGVLEEKQHAVGVGEGTGCPGSSPPGTGTVVCVEQARQRVAGAYRRQPSLRGEGHGEAEGP